MPIRVQWDKYEVALLFRVYETIIGGSDVNEVAFSLSETLRKLAGQRGFTIDDTYRSVNGMKMQLGNVQYLFTDGAKGLSGASSLIREMYQMYQQNQADYQEILKEAIRLTGEKMPVEEAFFAYAKGRINLSENQLAEYLKKASDYCHLKQPLLGMTNVIAVRDIQKKIAEGKLLRFRFGKDTQLIRNVTKLYYSFVKTYRASKPEKTVLNEEKRVEVAAEEIKTNQGIVDTKGAETADKENSGITAEDPVPSADVGEPIQDEKLWVDFSRDATYLFTKPVHYVYKGKTCGVKSWNSLYAELCGALFADYHDQFMSIMNGDVPGYRALAFSDEQNKEKMRVARQFAQGYYLESNIDATNIVRRIRGLYQLFDLGEELSIAYRRTKDGNGQKSKVLLSAEKGINDSALKDFKDFLLKQQKLAERTSRNYCRSILRICEYIRRRGLNIDLLSSNADEVEQATTVLMSRPDFVEINDRRHNQFNAALAQYRYYLLNGDPTVTSPDYVVHVKRDDRWLPILAESFPDGYILNDFLSQFQAGAFWQERYGEACPIEGVDIDNAMKAIGSIRDGRVYAKTDDDNKLIIEICSVINDTLSKYSCVYRSTIYDRFRSRLAAYAIYTESVMTQQLLESANGGFYSTYQVFARRGKEASVAQDCRQVLRDHGGAMVVSDIAEKLWFIPYDLVYHNLSVDSETLNVGTGTWMLAEQFPLSKENADKIGDMLDECFLSQDFVQQADIMPLLRRNLPSIADNLSGLSFTAVFNILNYYLRDRFSFSKAIIAPKGARTDFRNLFISFAGEHEHFTLDELSAFANDLNIPIYWESTFNGGAVRISKKEFVNRRLISFDVDATDKALESICTGDYLPIQAVSTAMMVHLPTCGNRWNGYLLLSYIYGFSKTFWLSYNSLGKTGCYGAMVKRSCAAIDSYERLVEQVLTDDSTWDSEEDALALLVQKGYQARLRLNGITQIVARARQNKLTDGR